MKSIGEPENRERFAVSMNPELYNSLRDKCRNEGIQMNLILECFMHQYVNGMDIHMIEQSAGAAIQLSTTTNKEISHAFKAKCKSEGRTIKLVMESFITLYNEGKYELALRKKE